MVDLKNRSYEITSPDWSSARSQLESTYAGLNTDHRRELILEYHFAYDYLTDESGARRASVIQDEVLARVSRQRNTGPRGGWELRRRALWEEFDSLPGVE